VPYTFKHGDRPLEGITVQRAVGRGGFGEVYYALTDSGKQTALKYLRENPEIELRGISHVMNLKSPHLITIYDVRHNENHEPFVLMEYVSGPSLRELLIAEPGGLGPQKAAFFLSGIAQGLSYLHERGIVHRDLKPGNIFYDDGYVKIGDYGLSKHISVSRHSGQTVSVGTVHYMAPEIGSGSYTKAIDIYALGVILYEMLTGRLPFTGASMGEILMRHLSEQPDISGIPEPFAGVIAKALAKDPHQRFQDVNEMVDRITASTEISASVASFDPSTLASVPRSPEATDAERTRTRTPQLPPIPPLDVREAASPLETFGDHAERFVRGIEEKVNALDQHLGGRKRSTPCPPTPPDELALRSGRRRQFFLLTVVMIAVAIGMALVSHTSNPPATAITLMMYLAGGTLGALLAYFKFARRALTRSPLLDRLAYAGLATAFMAPGLGPAAAVRGDALVVVFLAPIAALLLCDWSQRAEDGRRGIVSGGAALWPAVFGFIATAIGGAKEYALLGAGLCATLSLLVQAGAAMWPFRVGELPIAGTARSRPPRARTMPTPAAPVTASPAPAAAPAPERAPTADGERTEAVANGRGPFLHLRFGVANGERTEAVADGTPVSSTADEAGRPSDYPPALAQPSFVGRSASAGASFLGKIMLLAGVVLTLAYASQFDLRDSMRDGLTLEDGYLRVWNLGEVDLAVRVPRSVLIVPFLVGTVFLMIARRHDGAAHFLRGFLGSGLLLAAGLLALGPAADTVRIFVTDSDWQALSYGIRPVWLVLVSLMFIFALALLFWPKRSPNQAIVI